MYTVLLNLVVCWINIFFNFLLIVFVLVLLITQTVQDFLVSNMSKDKWIAREKEKLK